MLTRPDFAAKQIIVFSPMKGDKLSFRNDNVVITDGEGKVIHQSTCYRLFALFIIGHITITSGLIQRAKKFQFAIVFMSTTLRPYCVISDFAEGNTILRQKQYTYDGFEAAKQLIANKIANQEIVVKDKRNKAKYDYAALDTIEDCIGSIPSACDINELMSIEGRASKVYFRAWFDNIDWYGRKPRIKFDMTNALLDIGYTMLFSYVDAVAAVFGFDRYKGILHTQFYMRKSLTCDLVEPFRVIIDKQVKSGINLKQFNEADFYIDNSQWRLRQDKNAQYSEIFIQAILNHKEDVFMYIQQFYRQMMKGSINENMPRWTIR